MDRFIKKIHSMWNATQFLINKPPSITIYHEYSCIVVYSKRVIRAQQIVYRALLETENQSNRNYRLIAKLYDCADKIRIMNDSLTDGIYYILHDMEKGLVDYLHTDSFELMNPMVISAIKCSDVGICKLLTATTAITALYIAIREKNLTIAKVILDHYSHYVNPIKIDEKWFWPLLCAVKMNDYKMVELLLDKGAVLDIPTTTRPLFHVKDIAIIELFIQREINIDLKDTLNRSYTDVGMPHHIVLYIISKQPGFAS